MRDSALLLFLFFLGALGCFLFADLLLVFLAVLLDFLLKPGVRQCALLVGPLLLQRVVLVHQRLFVLQLLLHRAQIGLNFHQVGHLALDQRLDIVDSDLVLSVVELEGGDPIRIFMGVDGVFQDQESELLDL